MLDSIMTLIFGSKHDRDLKKLLPILEQVNAEEAWASSLSKEEFLEQTNKFKADISSCEKEQVPALLDKILPKAYAMAREAAKRTIGERPFDSQILGSIVLHQGKIAELKTGEGKTLMTVAPAYLNALTGDGVHVITVNDYLAERNAVWMGPIYDYLGVSVGIIKANMDNAARKIAYDRDITYGTNNEFGFDYLRDNMQIALAQKVQRGFPFCIIDEIDSILIDEARTPLIISGQGEDDTAKFYEVDKLIGQLEEVQKKPGTDDYPDEVQGEEVIGDYKIDEKGKRVSFTDAGMLKIESILQKKNMITGSLFNPDNFEYVHYFTQAVRAHSLYKNDVDYVVKDNHVQIVDEFTGRILEGRRYGDGLHQAIEAKEHIRIAQRNRTLATITFQNFFRMYAKLSGMTGTAETEAIEFNKIYELDVVVIPTHKPVARIDENDEVYLNENDKWEAIAKEIQAAHSKGQPVLVGTVSIEKSEHLSGLLTKKGLIHEVLNAKNHAREALIIAEAGAKGAITIATNMAGRGTDIKLGGNPEFRAQKRAGTNATPEQYAEALKLEKEKWQKEYEEVKNCGGLYVIGSERHESRRIDNQLRGRSGRQGDPGRSKFFISMDDDLMRLFGGDRMKMMMSRIGMTGGEPIYHPWLTKGIENAQTKVEERNFEIRKRLLEYDDVLNDHRNSIYEQRDEILSDENLSERVLKNAKVEVENLLSDFNEKGHKNTAQAVQALSDELKRIFSMQFDISDLTEKNTDAIKERIYAALQNDITEKETLVSKERLNMFIRFQYIQEIDKKWLDHLETLESLREAVHLRSYGSKNPLTEYKIDGFNIFYDMLDEIRTSIVSRVFRVKVQTAEDAKITRQHGVIRSMNAQHNAMHSFDANASRAAADKGPMASRRQGESVTVVRTTPKIGRNDPCPCGSGKKYKNCCGR
ncbi:MAG: preprotein translocase subunit SecA [Treponemataceae bacterium]|nr:preprotein translocase subunit SecA [Treponemataceae bacterium]